MKPESLAEKAKSEPEPLLREPSTKVSEAHLDQAILQMSEPLIKTEIKRETLKIENSESMSL